MALVAALAAGAADVPAVPVMDHAAAPVTALLPVVVTEPAVIGAVVPDAVEAVELAVVLAADYAATRPKVAAHLPASTCHVPRVLKPVRSRS